MVHRRLSGDIYLQPGDIWFGNKKLRIHTLLGSCVAITLWHPTRHIGGMCHYLLPNSEGRHTNDKKLGFYADSAINYFVKQIRNAGLNVSDFETKVFGAGNMFGLDNFETNVANQNAKQAIYLLKHHGFEVKAVDLGGLRYRKVYLDLKTGDVWLSYGKKTQNPNKKKLI